VGAGVGRALGAAEGLAGTNADEGAAEGALLCVTAVDLELYLAMAITTASTAKKKMTCDLFICR
jgi:hypothetical protein